MSILEIRDLRVSYGGIEALKGISLDVEEGQIVTLVGANGAGKSTTLKAVSGLVEPSSGVIRFKGEEIQKLDSQKIVERGLPWCRKAEKSSRICRWKKICASVRI